MRSGKLRAITASGVLAIAMVATPVWAQDSDAQLWSTTAVSVPLGKPVSLDGELVLRFGDAADGLYESEAGGFVTFAVSDSVKIGFGYTRVTNYAGGQVTRSEDRPRQQIEASLGTLLGGKLSARLRIEERIRSNGSDTGFRLRPRLKWKLPVGRTGSTALVLSHESFVELNDADWGQDAGYRRMRNFVGFDLALAGPVRAELGYLNQYGFRHARRDTIDHVLSISVAAKF